MCEEIIRAIPNVKMSFGCNCQIPVDYNMYKLILKQARCAWRDVLGAS